MGRRLAVFQLPIQKTGRIEQHAHLAPLSLILSLFVWLCAGLLSCSGFVFKLASGLLSLLAFAVLITYSAKNGIILLVLAFLISPMGLPMLAVQGLGKLQGVNAAVKGFLYR